MDFSKRNGFKETEIGMIPEDWEVKKISEVTNLISVRGQINVSPYIEIGDIDINSKNYKYKNKVSVKGCKKAFKDNLIISKVRPTRGAISLIKEDEIEVSSAFTVLSAKENADIEYIFLTLAYNDNFFSYLGKLQKGSNYPSCRDKDILDYSILLPPLSEQKKIAAVLSAVQEAKEKTEDVIKATKELKKSLMKHLFTYGPVSPKEAGNVALKETEIGMIPEDWEVVKLIDAFEFSRKPRDLSISKDDLIPFIPMEYIPDEKIFVNKYDSKKIEEIGSGTFFLKGDLLVAKITPSFENGKQCLVRELPTDFGYATTEVWSIHATDKGNILYLFYYLKRDDVRVSISSKMEGSTGRQRVPKKVLENLLLPLPPLPIQQKIAEILSAVDKKIEAEENKKKSLEDLFKTLLNDLMTGKIRVNNLEV